MAVTGANTNNTMAEGLRKIAQQITMMKFEPDANVPFLIHLETEILGYLKSPIDNAQAQGLSQVPGGPQAPPGPPQGPPQGIPQGFPQGVQGGSPPQQGPGPLTPPGGAPGAPGLAPGPGAINPDELRRMLNSGQGGQ